MVAGPQVSHLVVQYEAASGAKDATGQTSHHEQKPQFKRDFLQKVQKLSHAMRDLGNPFQEESQDLLSLDKKDTCLPQCSRTAKDTPRKRQNPFPGV